MSVLSHEALGEKEAKIQGKRPLWRARNREEMKWSANVILNQILGSLEELWDVQGGEAI